MSELNMNKRGLLDLIIAALPGITAKERVLLLQKFDFEEDFIALSKTEIEKILGRTIKCSWDKDEIRIGADRMEKVCGLRSIHWVSYTDSAFPPLLREMYDPPPVIFYRGVLPSAEKPLLAMVGTRKPSPEAAMQAYTIGREAGRAGISVVSGLALGIDAMSHKGNLSGGARGYAILGSGVDEVYPSSNRALAKQILDSGGALISEYPPGTKAGKWHFPARNRIISGFSRSVLVVEAPQKSGALITADFALEQGKELWVASSGAREQYESMYDKLGTIKLASDGAQIIYSANDILNKWNINYSVSNNAEIALCENKEALVSSMAKYLEIEI